MGRRAALFRADDIASVSERKGRAPVGGTFNAEITLFEPSDYQVDESEGGGVVRSRRSVLVNETVAEVAAVLRDAGVTIRACAKEPA